MLPHLDRGLGAAPHPGTFIKSWRVMRLVDSGSAQSRPESGCPVYHERNSMCGLAQPQTSLGGSHPRDSATKGAAWLAEGRLAIVGVSHSKFFIKAHTKSIRLLIRLLLPQAGQEGA